MVKTENFIADIRLMNRTYNITSESQEDRLTNEDHNTFSFLLIYKKHIKLLNQSIKDNLHHLEDQVIIYKEHEDPTDAIAKSILVDTQSRLKQILEEKKDWEKVYDLRFKKLYLINPLLKNIAYIIGLGITIAAAIYRDELFSLLQKSVLK